MDVMRLPGIFEISKALTMQRDGMHAFLGVFLHPGSKAETAWFERNFIFFWMRSMTNNVIEQ